MPDHNEPTATGETNEAETPQQPSLLRIVKGDPTPEEVAALVSVVSGMSAGAQSTPARPTPKPQWGANHRKVRGTHRHGPGAWRATAR